MHARYAGPNTLGQRDGERRCGERGNVAGPMRGPGRDRSVEPVLRQRRRIRGERLPRRVRHLAPGHDGRDRSADCLPDGLFTGVIELTPHPDEPPANAHKVAACATGGNVISIRMLGLQIFNDPVL